MVLSKIKFNLDSTHPYAVRFSSVNCELFFSLNYLGTLIQLFRRFSSHFTLTTTTNNAGPMNTQIEADSVDSQQLKIDEQ